MQVLFRFESEWFRQLPYHASATSQAQIDGAYISRKSAALHGTRLRDGRLVESLVSGCGVAAAISRFVSEF